MAHTFSVQPHSNPVHLVVEDDGMVLLIEGKGQHDVTAAAPRCFGRLHG